MGDRRGSSLIPEDVCLWGLIEENHVAIEDSLMFQWLSDIFRPAQPSQVPKIYPPQSDMADVLNSCRRKFGEAPRQLSEKDLKSCRLSLTSDMAEMFKASKDPLLMILEDQDKLLRGGTIVWGHLVQANSMAFDRKNIRTLPANVLYSFDTYFDSDVMYLGAIARSLFAQKGTSPADREIREFVRVITDELERSIRRELPRHYCCGHSVFFADCFIQPSHLPGKCLTGSYFPMLVNPEETAATMILPSQYWPTEFVRGW